jgi:hypothetical protein
MLKQWLCRAMCPVGRERPTVRQYTRRLQAVGQAASRGVERGAVRWHAGQTRRVLACAPRGSRAHLFKCEAVVLVGLLVPRLPPRARHARHRHRHGAPPRRRRLKRGAICVRQPRQQAVPVLRPDLVSEVLLQGGVGWVGRGDVWRGGGGGCAAMQPPNLSLPIHRERGAVGVGCPLQPAVLVPESGQGGEHTSPRVHGGGPPPPPGNAPSSARAVKGRGGRGATLACPGPAPGTAPPPPAHVVGYVRQPQRARAAVALQHLARFGGQVLWRGPRSGAHGGLGGGGARCGAGRGRAARPGHRRAGPRRLLTALLLGLAAVGPVRLPRRRIAARRGDRPRPALRCDVRRRRQCARRACPPRAHVAGSHRA